jgi:hypothetical protein
MAEWNLRYEKGFKIPVSEQNYLLKTINDFTELSSKELEILEKIRLNKKETING